MNSAPQLDTAIKVRTAKTVSHFSRPLPQIGLCLIGIVISLFLCQALAFRFTTYTLSIILLLITLLIGVAVWKSYGGFTSLIGLFFLTTIVFNLGRPILWLLLQDKRVYDLTFGATFSASEDVISRLLMFWCIAIAAFYGGYFILYNKAGRFCPPLSVRARSYCQRCFWITLLIVMSLLPLEMINNVKAFSSGGYTALYAGQTHYKFSWLRLEDFLLPSLFALGVLIDKQRNMRIVTFAAIAYIMTGIVVGERAAAGQWILVCIWYLSAIAGRRLNKFLLILLSAVAVTIFQFIVIWRQGQNSSITVIQFLVDQGITFLLPEISQWVPAPPLHTIFSSLLPLGGIYSSLGVGSPETVSLGNYLSSHMSIDSFMSGQGLGGTFYLEIYYACGATLGTLSAGCVLAGLLLRKLEEAAARNYIMLFYLCCLFPSIVLLPRGTISAVTSEFVYSTIYMLALCGSIWLLSMASKSRRTSFDPLPARPCM